MLHCVDAQISTASAVFRREQQLGVAGIVTVLCSECTSNYAWSLGVLVFFRDSQFLARFPGSTKRVSMGVCGGKLFCLVPCSDSYNGGWKGCVKHGEGPACSCCASGVNLLCRALRVPERGLLRWRMGEQPAARQGHDEVRVGRPVRGQLGRRQAHRLWLLPLSQRRQGAALHCRVASSNRMAAV